MNQNIIGAAVCTMTGALVAFVNFLISKGILRTHPEKLAFSTVLRQLIQVGYLAAVYFIGSQLEMNIIPLLIGAAVGMTLPMLFFTKKLISINQQLTEKNNNGEADKNG